MLSGDGQVTVHGSILFSSVSWDLLCKKGTTTYKICERLWLFCTTKCSTTSRGQTLLFNYSIRQSPDPHPAPLKGMSRKIFRPVFWPVWMHLDLNVNRLWFFNFKEGSSILYSYFKYWCVSYQTFSEIRRIDNCIKDTLMLLKNILREPWNKLSIILGDSTNLREVVTPFAAFLEGPLTQNKEKLENHELSCQSFSEILWIYGKVWHETH
jgi:hypothetical protein